MNSTRRVLAIALLVLFILIGVLLVRRDDHSTGELGGSLTLYCAAGLRRPVEEIARKYAIESGVNINLHYGGSGALLANLEAAKTGDLYLSADSSYTDIARQKGLIDETLTVSYQRPVIAYQKGNPSNIRSLDDLLRADVRVGLARPEAASVGKLSQKMLDEAGLWDEIQAKVVVFKPTVNEIANDVKLGTIDAAIIWDTVADLYEEIDILRVPLFEKHRVDLTLAVLRSTQKPTAALRFARYLTARDQGLILFKKYHFDVIEGDLWKVKPEIVLYSGGMLRPAVEDAIRQFELREGVEIVPNFNGCGVLVSLMKAGEQPDAYLSCDLSFMNDVKNLFEQPVTITHNTMVILTTNENPQNITRLEDLTNPGVRLGLAHPTKSALGALCKRFLEHDELYEAISKNIVLDSATGDFLVLQIRSNSLDAVIVYKSNALASPETLKDCRMIEINRLNWVARQPIAVGRNSDHKWLTQRLLDHITTTKVQERFLSLGFQWELDTPGQ